MTIRIAAMGLDHPHIYGQTRCLTQEGAELVAFHEPKDEIALPYGAAFPNARRVADARAILEDPSIHMVLTSGIPDERAGIAIAAMRHGKDVMTDKPGCVTLDQLADIRACVAETGRIWSACFSERFENAATEEASRLVAAGAIGTVVQTIGLGPHSMGLNKRPDWFFQRARYGGILCDIAAHQCDQFLHFTGSTRAEVVAAHIANHANPARPELEDFGEVMLRGNGGTGYIRVDWYTPKGLGVWGDGRLVILGTEGYLELRKYIDVAGRSGGDHLFLVDRNETRHIACAGKPLPYGGRLIDDVHNRTETAMAQAHAFLATELALQAEAKAVRVERTP
jgi:predicted dehydrogenase